MRTNYTPDIEAQVTFLATEDGGRIGPVSTGYRGDFYVRGNNYVAVHEYPDVESVNPGQTARVVLRVLRPHLVAPVLVVNEEFEIREATRTVARGRVTKLVDLAKHADEYVP